MEYAPLLQTADNFMWFKYIIKNVARNYGKTVTFMPKPIFQDNGSGMNTHMSFWKDGKPLFAGDGYAGLSDLALHAIGGAREYSEEQIAHGGSPAAEAGHDLSGEIFLPRVEVEHAVHGVIDAEEIHPAVTVEVEGQDPHAPALASDPGNLYAYHAVGHAYISRGDYREALETFERAASLEHYPHILWHLGEARAILGYEQFTRDYWAHTSPVLPLFERIELLWRLEVLRHLPVDVTTWKDLAEQGERLLAHAEYLTIWMHHWIGLALARAGEVEKARRQIAYLRQLPEGKASGHWSTLGADLLEGELAFMRGDYAAAERFMAPAVQQIHAMGGGSREQKDIFKDVFLELQRRLGHTDAVIELAQQRLRTNPRHIPSLAAMAWAYGQTGQTSQQQQICQQLLSRAEEVRLHPQAPELFAARQALQLTA
jgi:tetratricopeptide (TPR) repeat protein